MPSNTKVQEAVEASRVDSRQLNHSGKVRARKRLIIFVVDAHTDFFLFSCQILGSMTSFGNVADNPGPCKIYLLGSDFVAVNVIHSIE